VRAPKHFIAAAVITAVLVASGFGLAAGFTVMLTPSGAQPPRTTVALGDTVTFVNSTPDSRVLTSTYEGFGTTTIPAGASHEYVAVSPGTIAYRFGSERTDRGSIVVQRVGSVTLAAGLRSVTFGQALTLSGRANPVGFPVSIEERLRDGSDWKQLTTVTSEADGAFSLKVRPPLGAQYRASLFDDVLRSPRISIEVRPKIRLASSVQGTRTGRTINLRVYVAPIDAASRASLFLYNPRRTAWNRVSTHRLANGRALIPWKVVKGRSRLRASSDRRDAKPGLQSAVSRLIVITGVGPAPAP
jgi:hypothetical protein